jgi:hypothetical protein
MKTILPFLLLTISLNAQTSRSQAEPLKVEWLREIPAFEEDHVSGLLINSNNIIASLQAGHIAGFTKNGEELWSAESNSGVYMLGRHGQYIYTQGYMHLEQRTEQGNILNNYVLKNVDDNTISARNGQIWNSSLYTTNMTHLLLKYDLSGDLIYSKKIAENCDNKFLCAGGGFVYVFANIKNPAQGTRLIQFDTTGNQKWSVSVGDVRAMLADDEGNCYIAPVNVETTLIKYNTQGQVIWSTLVTGQFIEEMSKRGDSIFVCGRLSLGSEENQKCAYSIISAKTGKILQQQSFAIYKPDTEIEYFSKIASDGDNVYVGGTHGKMGYYSCFLIKLSKEGKITEIQDQESSNSFSVFPNPSGSKFTISSSTSISTVHITMRNAAGQTVFYKTISRENGKNIEVNPGELPSGTYIIEIVSGNKKTVKKVVVE